MSEQGVAAAADAPISAREAAVLINAPVEEKPEPVSESAAPEKAEASPPESAEEADAAPAEEQPSGETEGEDDPASEPPIDPPRSWTKEDKAAFATLPRETQERLLALDRTREVELRRGQNDAAERLKAVEAREQAAEQTRQQYEQALPQLLLQLNADYQREFGQPTWAEIENWSKTEPEKYLRWDASYKRSQAVASELQQQQSLQMQHTAEARKAYVAEQTRLLSEKAPEFADEKVLATKRADVLTYLEGVGYPRAEIAAYAQDFAPMSIHDHRFQLILRDALRFREAEQASKKAAPKVVPPVQRPGTAPLKGEGRQAQLKDLDKQLGHSGKAKDAARLIAALR